MHDAVGPTFPGHDRSFAPVLVVLATIVALAGAGCSSSKSEPPVAVAPDDADAGASLKSVSGLTEEPDGESPDVGVEPETSVSDDSPDATGDGGGDSAFGSGASCATVPAAATASPSSASGTNIIGLQGATMTIRDGYAQIAQHQEQKQESADSGTPGTTYMTSLTFLFTDYPNALGYAEVDASKEGSHTLTAIGNWASLASTTAPPHFAVGTFSANPELELEGFSATCISEEESILIEGGSVTITSLTSTRIKGSFAGVNEFSPAGSTASITVDFDVPLIASPDAVALAADGGVATATADGGIAAGTAADGGVTAATAADGGEAAAAAAAAVASLGGLGPVDCCLP